MTSPVAPPASVSWPAVILTVVALLWRSVPALLERLEIGLRFAGTLCLIVWDDVLPRLWRR